MSALDFVKFDAKPLQEPCNYIVVPEFIKPEMLKGINADFLEITEPGRSGVSAELKKKATGFRQFVRKAFQPVYAEMPKAF
jgi:hypothetical protein